MWSGIKACYTGEMANWNRKLTRPLRTNDGIELRTLKDAADFAANNVPPNKAWQNQWQHAAKCLMEAAEGGDLYAATWAMYNALVLDLRFDMASAGMD